MAQQQERYENSVNKKVQPQYFRAQEVINSQEELKIVDLQSQQNQNQNLQQEQINYQSHDQQLSSEIQNLTQICQALLEEQKQLKEKIQNQEKIITQLSGNKSVQERKRDKNIPRVPKQQNTKISNHLKKMKAKHAEEERKIQHINEKIEEARKRMEKKKKEQQEMRLHNNRKWQNKQQREQSPSEVNQEEQESKQELIYEVQKVAKPKVYQKKNVQIPKIDIQETPPKSKSQLQHYQYDASSFIQHQTQTFQPKQFQASQEQQSFGQEQNSNYQEENIMGLINNPLPQKKTQEQHKAQAVPYNQSVNKQYNQQQDQLGLTFMQNMPPIINSKAVMMGEIKPNAYNSSQMQQILRNSNQSVQQDNLDSKGNSQLIYPKQGEALGQFLSEKGNSSNVKRAQIQQTQQNSTAQRIVLKDKPVVFPKDFF